MAADGTITLNLRAEGSRGELGDAALTYPPGHPQHPILLKHVGGLKAGESKCFPPWPNE
jgi:hypothetical protein